MPLSLHRFQRLYSVLCGPYSPGASRHLNPLRLKKIIPLRTRRSSLSGHCFRNALPGSEHKAYRGTSESRARNAQSAHRSTRKNQTCSPLVSRDLNHAASRKSMGPEPKPSMGILTKKNLRLVFLLGNNTPILLTHTRSRHRLCALSSFQL